MRFDAKDPSLSGGSMGQYFLQVEIHACHSWRNRGWGGVPVKLKRVGVVLLLTVGSIQPRSCACVALVRLPARWIRGCRVRFFFAVTVVLGSVVVVVWMLALLLLLLMLALAAGCAAAAAPAASAAAAAPGADIAGDRFMPMLMMFTATGYDVAENGHGDEDGDGRV